MSLTQSLGWRALTLGAPGPSAAGGALGPPATVLPSELKGFTLDDQERNYWCWAAVGQSVASFRQRVCFSSQCDLAKDVLIGCTDCTLAVCDRAAPLRRVLVGHLGLKVTRFRRLPDFSVIEDLLRDQNPVLLRVLPQRGSVSHALVITKAVVVNGEKRLRVLDPHRDRIWQGLKSYRSVKDDTRYCFVVR